MHTAIALLLLTCDMSTKMPENNLIACPEDSLFVSTGEFCDTPPPTVLPSPAIPRLPDWEDSTFTDLQHHGTVTSFHGPLNIPEICSSA